MRVCLEPSLPDQYGCLRVRVEVWPGGQLGVRNEYVLGELYVREHDYDLFERLLTTGDSGPVRVTSSTKGAGWRDGGTATPEPDA
jgi:hypothetical protein